jgi:hypothetical protein
VVKLQGAKHSLIGDLQADRHQRPSIRPDNCRRTLDGAMTVAAPVTGGREPVQLRRRLLKARAPPVAIRLIDLPGRLIDLPGRVEGNALCRLCYSKRYRSSWRCCGRHRW